MSYNMVNRGGHIEVWDECGRFVLSADTIGEAKGIWMNWRKNKLPLNGELLHRRDEHG